jgi:hypothetical protein
MPVNEDYPCFNPTQKKEVLQSTVLGAYEVMDVDVYAFPLSILKYSNKERA